MRTVLVILIVLALLVFAMPALAQEIEPTPDAEVIEPPPLGEETTRADVQNTAPVTPDQIVKPAEVMGAILALLGMFAAGVGPLAQAVTSVYKFVVARWFPDSPFARAVPLAALIVPVVLTVLFWVADAFGLSELYVVVANNLVTIIPLLLSMIGAFVGQAFIYEKVARPLNLPVLGKSFTQMEKKPAGWHAQSGMNTSTIYAAPTAYPEGYDKG